MLKIITYAAAALSAILVGLTYTVMLRDPASASIISKTLVALKLSKFVALTPLVIIPIVLVLGKRAKWLLPPLLLWGCYYGVIQARNCSQRPFCFAFYEEPRLFQGFRIFEAISAGTDTINNSFSPFFRLQDYLRGASISVGTYSPGAQGYPLKMLARVPNVKFDRYSATLPEPLFRAITQLPNIENFYFNDIGRLYILPNAAKQYKVYGYKANVIFIEALPNVQ